MNLILLEDSKSVRALSLKPEFLSGCRLIRLNPSCQKLTDLGIYPPSCVLVMDFNLLLKGRISSKTVKQLLHLSCFQAIVFFGEVEDKILLPFKIFAKKLKICAIYFLPYPFIMNRFKTIIDTVQLTIDMRSKARKILPIRQRIELNSETVKPYYQPKIFGRTMKVSGYEVLGRVKLGNKMLMPDQFLDDLIEENKITYFTYLIIRNSLSEIKNLENFHGTLSFNVDYQSLDIENFFSRVGEILSIYKFPFERLIIEISEKNPIYSSNVLINLTKFKSSGAGVSIDDFGMADSGFSQLLTLPFTEIKIDKSYIFDMQSSDHMLKVVKSLASVANCMEVNIVAEGVENKYQISLLESMGIDTFQGFYFSRPISIEKIALSNMTFY